MQKNKIVVVGAVNVDICGTSDEQLILYDSNPGHSTMTYGGVGRNIAENLCRFGYDVEMITVLADDVFTSRLVEASEKAGISFTHSMHVKDAVCSTYISINNNNGDLILAVSDMKIYDLMTVDFIKTKIDVLNDARAIIIDTNIPADVISYIAGNCTAPLIVDPVSTTKALKIKDIIGRFEIIKPNIYEAEILSGIKIESDDDLKKACSVFLDEGVKRIFITMAEEGVCYADNSVMGTLPICRQYPVVNVSGCGDAFISAVIWAFLNNENTLFMARAGECAAAISAKSNSTVCDDLSIEHIEKLMSAYK